MKKNKGVKSIKHAGKTIRWYSALKMVANDLGYVASTVKAPVLARMVSEKYSIPFASTQNSIFRAAIILVDRGVPIPEKPKGDFVYSGKRERSIRHIGAPHPDYVRQDGFYKTRQWRELRLLALDTCRCCQACGARPPDVQLHVDHVIPRYKAPHLSLELSNLQVLCEDCNIGKGAWSQADFRQHFKSI